MTRVACAACALALTAVAACGRIVVPPRGGDPELKLVTATAASDMAAVQQLLASGADPNAMVTFQGASHSAWEFALEQVRPKKPETIELVNVLLKAGANPNIAWGGGIAQGIARESDSRPIDLAMLHPDARVVRAILDAGMNPRFGQMALVMAVEEEDIEIVHLLVEHGVNVNSHPSANTPLTAAIEARNVALMTYLEDHGAREKP
jgi:ankyrin repeat protein